MSGDHTGIELADAAARACRENLPAILVKTSISDIPLLLNAYASMERLELAWNKSYDYLAFSAFRNMFNDDKLVFTEKLSYQKLNSVFDLPLLKYHDCDKSVCISMGCVIAEDKGRYACGIYRVEPLDSHRAVVHCRDGSGLRNIFDKYKKDIKITIAVGCSPFLVYAAACSLPEKSDELSIASAIGEIKYIETENHPVPSDTNVIIQGHLTGEMSMGGSFYNHTGECTAPAEYPVMEIDSVELMDGGVYQSTVVGKPPMEDVYLGQAAARIHFHRLKYDFAELSDIWHPVEGVFGRMCFVRAVSYSDQLLEALSNDWFYGKFKHILLFDESTDIRNSSDIMWRIANKVDIHVKRDNNIIIAY